MRKILLIALFPFMLSATTSQCLDYIELMHKTGNAALDTRSKAMFEMSLLYAMEANTVCKDPYWVKSTYENIAELNRILGDIEYRDRKDISNFRRRLRRSR